jgi:hypothetical protein
MIVHPLRLNEKRILQVNTDMSFNISTVTTVLPPYRAIFATGLNAQFGVFDSRT